MTQGTNAGLFLAKIIDNGLTECKNWSVYEEEDSSTSFELEEDEHRYLSVSFLKENMCYYMFLYGKEYTQDCAVSEEEIDKIVRLLKELS